MKPEIISLRFLSKLIILLLLAFAFYIIFVNLGKSPLDNWDEAWYGDMIKNMYRTGEIILPQWNHSFYYDKPPLYLWTGSLLSLIFGLSEFSIRLPSAIAGFIIVFLITIYAYKNWGFFAGIAAYASIVFNNLYIWRTRSGNIDTFVSLFIFIAYFLIISKNKNRYLFLGIIFACIYLSKASLVAFPFIIFILHEALYKRKQIKENIKEYLKFLLIFFGICGLWLGLGYLKSGKDFLDFYLLHSDRGSSTLSFKLNSSYISYTYYSLQRRYFYLFILGVVLFARKIKENKNFLMLSFSVLLLIFLSFSKNSNNWYLVPSIPFWSLAIGYGVYELLNIFNSFKIKYFVYLVFVFLITYISYKTYTVNITPILNTYSTVNQMQSGQKIKELTDENEIVVRLDHLYPATVYYSDRRILASPIEGANTTSYWISKDDLIKAINNKKIRWLIGTNESVNQFIKDNPTIKLNRVNVNNSEAIIEVKS